MEPFFREPSKARFLSRPNRFLARCRLGRRTVQAFLPNPGRLRELLLPDAVLFLEHTPGTERATQYTVAAVERDGAPVMLHTHVNNAVALRLLREGRVPGLEEAEVVRAEVPFGRSRFDFLLRRNGRELFLEVKSCTLFGRRVAAFPDAVTTRGRRHLEELAALRSSRRSGAVLFLVHTPRVSAFMPEYHTDPEFARTLLAVRSKVEVIPLAVEWSRSLRLQGAVRRLPVPWKTVERENGDRGCYLLVLRLARGTRIEVGSLGRRVFPAGYYLYVGSARKGLAARTARHRRLRKKKFWHIDFLRQACTFEEVLPIRTRDDLECRLARATRKIADGEVPGFGASDCGCASHLFHMKTDPMDRPSFHGILQYFRMDRLVEEG